MKPVIQFFSILSAIVISTGLAGCGSGSSSGNAEDSSTSGSVGATIGGAYNGSSSGGTNSYYMNPSAKKKFDLAEFLNPIHVVYASTPCPTYSAALINAGEQTYADCSFGNSAAVWNGGVTFTGSVGDVTRVVATGTTRTAASGTLVTLNTSGAGLTPAFGSDPTLSSGGTTFTPTSLAINGVNLVASKSGSTLFNHLLTTASANGGQTLTVSGSTITGTVITYHNLAKVKATSVVNVTMSPGCCQPTGGTIKTTFNTTDAGALSKFNGVTEILSFSGSCGAATYSGPESESGSVTLAHCF